MTPRTSRKAATPKGLLPKIKNFIDALGDRYHWALKVIDEALASDNLKDKIWAVDFIFKRLPTPTGTELEPKAPPAEEKKAKRALTLAQMQALQETELVNRIRGYLKDWEQE